MVKGEPKSKGFAVDDYVYEKSLGVKMMRFRMRYRFPKKHKTWSPWFFRYSLRNKLTTTH